MNPYHSRSENHDGFSEPTCPEKKKGRQQLPPRTSVIDEDVGTITIETGEGSVCQGEKAKGRVMYKKEHFCYYCGKGMARIFRHLEQVHGHEEEVHQYMTLDKNDKLRDTLCKLLKNKGDFNHNLEVLKAEKGIFVASRRPTSSATPARYFPCPQCFGFFSKEEIWRHHCITPPPHTHTQKESEASVLHRSKAFLYAALYEDSQDISELLAEIRDDEVGQTLKKDPLLKKLMAFLWQKYDGRYHQHIRQKAREVAKVLLYIWRNYAKLSSTPLHELLQPEYFDMFVQAVREIAQDGDKETLSFPLKIGHTL